MFIWMIFSESQNIWLPNLVWWCRIMSQSVMLKFLSLLLSSESRSQQRLIWSKYDSFYYIFWTVDSLATKLGLMIHHQKPDCSVMVSSKLPNILFQNFQSVMQKDWFAILKVTVTARAHMIKIWKFLLYLLNCWSFCDQTWFDSTLL